MPLSRRVAGDRVLLRRLRRSDAVALGVLLDRNRAWLQRWLPEIPEPFTLFDAYSFVATEHRLIRAGQRLGLGVFASRIAPRSGASGLSSPGAGGTRCRDASARSAARTPLRAINRRGPDDGRPKHRPPVPSAEPSGPGGSSNPHVARLELVGFCALHSIARGIQQSAGVSYWVAESARGRGLMTEAVALLCAIAFEELGLHRLWAGIAIENLPSCRLIERLGFVREGLHRRELFIAGRWQDLFHYAMLRDDFTRFESGDGRNDLRQRTVHRRRPTPAPSAGDASEFGLNPGQALGPVAPCGTDVSRRHPCRQRGTSDLLSVGPSPITPTSRKPACSAARATAHPGRVAIVTVHRWPCAPSHRGTE